MHYCITIRNGLTIDTYESTVDVSTKQNYLTPIYIRSICLKNHVNDKHKIQESGYLQRGGRKVIQRKNIRRYGNILDSGWYIYVLI